MSNKNKIIEKIRKLLSLANDQQGTPEGEASLSRAMKLMADYGVNDSDVKEEYIDTTLDVTTIDVSHLKYNKQQSALINQIATALNCYAITSVDKYAKTSIVLIYGRAVDRERVSMLFPVASNAMIASSVKAVPSGSYRIRLRRLSHMTGYAVAIGDSLRGHEQYTRENYGDSKELILADYENAKNLAHDKHDNIIMTRQSKVYSDDYDNGYRDGKSFDTGKNTKLGNKRALSA